MDQSALSLAKSFEQGERIGEWRASATARAQSTAGCRATAGGSATVTVSSTARGSAADTDSSTAISRASDTGLRVPELYPRDTAKLLAASETGTETQIQRDIHQAARNSHVG